MGAPPGTGTRLDVPPHSQEVDDGHDHGVVAMNLADVDCPGVEGSIRSPTIREDLVVALIAPGHRIVAGHVPHDIGYGEFAAR
jgi:hypothetical protein